MPFNGAGVFQRVYDWVTDRNNDIRIRADRTDEEMYGFATGLSNTICRDGQSTVAADIPWNGKRITNMGAATQDLDALNRQTADGRYVRSPQDLITETAFADGDVFGFYDLSALATRGGTYSSLKTALTTDFRADGRMFPATTRMAFQQTTPPTGWTKETGAAYNDATLRFTTGTVSTGGSQSFNTTFASRTFSGNIGNDTPTILKTASHNHSTALGLQTSGAPGGAVSTGTNGPTTSSSTGSSDPHDHSLTMNAANFSVKYVETCIGQKA